MYKKIGVFIIIGLFLIMPCWAELGTDLKAPDEFKQANNWDKAIYDIYCLKDNESVELTITPYSDEDYEFWFKDNASRDYYVNDIGNGMTMGTDNYFNEGYVLEVVEHGGNKYIVYTYLHDNPTNDMVKDSSKYLDEFNEINNVEPVEV